MYCFSPCLRMTQTSENNLVFIFWKEPVFFCGDKDL